MKKIWLLLAAILPFNALRIFAYRLIPGYSISSGCRIGIFNIIRCDRLVMEDAAIGRFNRISAIELRMLSKSSIRQGNRIIDANSVLLDQNSEILSSNRVVGTRPGLTPFKENENMLIGPNTTITVGHRFDLSDTIEIGENVTFGGTLSEVWTHGFDVNRIKVQAKVQIGRDVYIGSRCQILPGVSICDRTSIGAGTVVSKSIDQPGFYVSSQLIRKGEGQDYTNEEGVRSHHGAKFFRK